MLLLNKTLFAETSTDFTDRSLLFTLHVLLRDIY